MATYLPARIAALASFGFVLMMNAVATALPLAGLSVGGVSDKYTTSGGRRIDVNCLKQLTQFLTDYIPCVSFRKGALSDSKFPC